MSDDMARLIEELRAFERAEGIQGRSLTSERYKLAADALEASEAARVNLEAVIAEAKEGCEKAAGEAGIIDPNWVLRRLYRAGDPVVLRDHDAKVTAAFRSRVAALVRLLAPEDMTPAAARQFEAILKDDAGSRRDRAHDEEPESDDAAEKGEGS